jgi:Methylpurine-DNA glycosylase (MPG)
LQSAQRQGGKIEMEDHDIRAALDRHWAASEVNDFEAEHAIYREDAVLEPRDGIPILQRNRQIEQLRDLARGPGRLTAAFRVDRRLDGPDLCREGPLWLGRSDQEPGEIGQSIRIGIARDANGLVRFYLRGSPFVSGPRLLRE